MGAEPLFDLGRLVSTPEALAACISQGISPASLIMRHVLGDDGDLDQEDKNANKRALRDGERIFSCYKLPDQRKCYVITEWDRSVTTLLLSDQY
jgi:hypothetical protein